MKLLRLPTFLLLTLLTGCSFSLVAVSYYLSQEKAQTLSEAFLTALDESPEATSEYLHDEFESDYPTIQTIVDQTRFNSPQNILVTQVENRAEKTENESEMFLGEVTGEFTCEGSDHVSDFTLLWLYNTEKEIWELINLNLEEC